MKVIKTFFKCIAVVLVGLGIGLPLFMGLVGLPAAAYQLLVQ